MIYVDWFHQNCRGISSTFFDFKCNVASFNYEFLVLTETWAIDSFYDRELGLFNYNIYRCGRFSLTSTSSRGADVLISRRKDIHSLHVHHPDLGTTQLLVSFNFDI